MSNNDLNFDELEYDPTAFDDINPNELDADELEAELAREEAALLGEQANATEDKSDVPPAVEADASVTATTELEEQTYEKPSKKEPSNTSTQAQTAKEAANNDSTSNTYVSNPGYHRNNRRNNHRPMNAPHAMGHVMNYPVMGGGGMMTPPMMGMGMPFPNAMMGGFPGAPGMMNYSGTIHINPKFAGNVQVQQEMLRMQQQQQWQQQQQAMAFQQAGAMRMPFYNNTPGNRNTPRPFAGGQQSNKEESTTIHDAGVKAGRERNIPYGSTKRRPSQDHVVDKKRLQVDASKSATGQQGISIKGVSKSADVVTNSSDLAQAPTLEHPAVVGGKSSRLVIGNLAADVPETELHRLGKVVPGGIKELQVDRPAGKATLSFQTIDAAVTFRRKYNRTLVGGQHITVSFT
ncbi:hypothetical protein K450DRAFT_264068 [Umbelopsis ramanniana AG]|uniref:RRM domain-containing protein n=1 Tax=Umbelopsis ramanniana AG TaxID=1314678 RepID=A0AAD5H6X2_UMBRA|nr:uncharacterized protein K450DRAFT_264068 [Umbelopsis ramanniana AG]KAI8574935.1 hypothetical protein K450DRAFT_264068 [Umbelopsis ramanniana AG]